MNSIMNLLLRAASIAVALLLLAPLVSAQSTPGASGHWEGSIQIPDKEMRVEVDLTKNDKGTWMGTISIPAQSLKGFPLANIKVQGNSVGFSMKGIPGDPTFEGALSADGKSITGNFMQGGGSLSFQMTRTGDAKFEVPEKSTPVTKELEGTWEGALEVNGKLLRLVLKISNQAEGTAAGSIVSLDQGGVEIPITTIAQTGSNLKLAVNTVNGSYTGDLNKESTQIAGQWTQGGGGALPLTFKRPAKPESKK